MKKKLLISVCIVLALTACGNSEERKGLKEKSDNLISVTTTSKSDDNIGEKRLGKKIVLETSFPQVENGYTYGAKTGIIGECDIEVLFKSVPVIDEDTQAGRIQYSGENGEKGAIFEAEGFGYYCTQVGNKLDSWSVKLRNDELFFADFLNGDMDSGFVEQEIRSCLWKTGIMDYEMELYPVSEEMFDYYCNYYNENLLMDDKDRPAREIFGEYKKFYYGAGRFLIDGVPIFDHDAGNSDNGSMICGSYFSVVYTADGLEALWVSNYYEIDQTDRKETEFLSENEIEDRFQEVIDNLILSDPVVITKIELVYTPIPQNSLDSMYENFIMTPTWAFVAEDGREWFFDAVTGKEIV